MYRAEALTKDDDDALQNNLDLAQDATKGAYNILGPKVSTSGIITFTKNINFNILTIYIYNKTFLAMFLSDINTFKLHDIITGLLCNKMMSRQIKARNL